MKYLYIELDIRDGEREHTHRVLHETSCENLDFAVMWYAAHYWGFGTKDLPYRWHDKPESERSLTDVRWYQQNDEICVEVGKWKELTKRQYNAVSKVIYG